jgi:hypothetical protein
MEKEMTPDKLIEKITGDSLSGGHIERVEHNGGTHVKIEVFNPESRANRRGQGNGGIVLRERLDKIGMEYKTDGLGKDTNHKSQFGFITFEFKNTPEAMRELSQKVDEAGLRDFKQNQEYKMQLATERLEAKRLEAAQSDKTSGRTGR